MCQLCQAMECAQKNENPTTSHCSNAKPTHLSESHNIDRNGETDWLQVGRGVKQGRICSLYLFSLYVEYTRRKSWSERRGAGF